MSNQFERTAMLFGAAAMDRLASSHVAVFGAGGVGGYCVEALARSGVGIIDIIDYDKIELTNLNRQIIALHSTLGRYKADVLRERVMDINPRARVNAHVLFYAPESSLDVSRYDYIVDAMDNVSAKLELVTQANAHGIRIISSMGAGNKIDPTLFEAADIYETSVCPLARVMRRELKKRGIEALRVVYSREAPLRPAFDDRNEKQPPGEFRTPGSCAFVPSVAGLILAGEVVKGIIGDC